MWRVPSWLADLPNKRDVDGTSLSVASWWIRTTRSRITGRRGLTVLSMCKAADALRFHFRAQGVCRFERTSSCSKESVGTRHTVETVLISIQSLSLCAHALDHDLENG